MRSLLFSIIHKAITPVYRYSISKRVSNRSTVFTSVDSVSESPSRVHRGPHLQGLSRRGQGERNAHAVGQPLLKRLQSELRQHVRHSGAQPQAGPGHVRGRRTSITHQYLRSLARNSNLEEVQSQAVFQAFSNQSKVTGNHSAAAAHSSIM